MNTPERKVDYALERPPRYLKPVLGYALDIHRLIRYSFSQLIYNPLCRSSLHRDKSGHGDNINIGAAEYCNDGTFTGLTDPRITGPAYKKIYFFV